MSVFNLKIAINDFFEQQKGIFPLSRQEQKKKVSLPPQVNANLDLIYANLKIVGIVNTKKNPISKNNMLNLEDFNIITYYKNIACGLLSYYRCVDNLNSIKSLVQYQIRYSLLYTLMNKHKLRSFRKTLEKFSSDIVVKKKGKTYSFLNISEIVNIQKGFLIGGAISNSYDYLNKLFSIF